MRNIRCPFCNEIFALNENTESKRFLTFKHTYSSMVDPNASDLYEQLAIYMRRCPGCDKITVESVGIGNQYPSVVTHIYPNSKAKQFPEYVPVAVREDYKEAYAILHLSPKASATLARRALQGLIRDFFGISKKSLFDEINAIKDQVSPMTWEAINSLRQIGNIGAHMEKDVNLIVDISDNEAEKLLKLIEYLIENWYIQNHEAELLMQDIQAIDAEKQTKRHDANGHS